MSADAELTIDQLAAESGVLSSTIRMYQQRGLLPPPRHVGRRAFYSPRHLDRLNTISHLQDRGHSLEGIKDLIELHARGENLESLFVSEAIDDAMERRFMTLEELTEVLLGQDVEPAREHFTNAEALGLVEFTDKGAMVSPIALELGIAIRDLGIPRDVLQTEFAVLFQSMLETADRFSDLYEQWVAAVKGPDAWSDLVELARDVVDFALLRALDLRRQERTGG